MRHTHRIALIAAVLAAAWLRAGGTRPGPGAIPGAGAGAAAPAARAGAYPLGAAPPAGGGARGVALSGGAPQPGMAQARGRAAPEVGAAPGPAHAAAIAASPRLDRPSVGAGAVTVPLSGFDPAAPRELTLWRVGREGAARLADARSGTDGRFTFPEIAVRESELAVTVRGEGPARGGPRVHLAGLPAPLLSAVRSRVAGAEVLRIWPSAAAARVIVANARGEGAPVPVAARPSAQERVVTLPLGGAEADATLFVAEEDAAGRRSGWQRVDAAP